MQNAPKTLSRRTVASGLAWSVPAVATVAAAPAFAASPCVCPEVTVRGEAVKHPGQNKLGTKQAYGFDIRVTNPTSYIVQVSPGTATVDFEKFGERSGDVLLFDKSICQAGATRLQAGDSKLTLDPGASTELYYVVNNTGNSANESGCITSTLVVTLLNSDGTPVDQDDDCAASCEVVFLPQTCFDETPPTC